MNLLNSWLIWTRHKFCFYIHHRSFSSASSSSCAEDRHKGKKNALLRATLDRLNQCKKNCLKSLYIQKLLPNNNQKTPHRNSYSDIFLSGVSRSKFSQAGQALRTMELFSWWFWLSHVTQKAETLSITLLITVLFEEGDPFSAFTLMGCRPLEDRS